MRTGSKIFHGLGLGFHVVLGKFAPPLELAPLIWEALHPHWIYLNKNKDTFYELHLIFGINWQFCIFVEIQYLRVLCNFTYRFRQIHY